MLPGSNGLKHPPPLEMVGDAPSYLISTLPKPLRIVETFHSFPLGTLFSSHVIYTIYIYIYIYIYFTCLPHGSPFYNFLKVGSSLFGLFSIYSQEQVIIHTLFFRSLNPCYLLLPRLLASIIIYVFIGLKEP